jgi:hypothetical protein
MAVVHGLGATVGPTVVHGLGAGVVVTVVVSVQQTATEHPRASGHATVVGSAFASVPRGHTKCSQVSGEGVVVVHGGRLSQKGSSAGAFWHLTFASPSGTTEDNVVVLLAAVKAA